MDKLALLGSWDPQGLLGPQGPQALSVQWNLNLRYLHLSVVEEQYALRVTGKTSRLNPGLRAGAVLIPTKLQLPKPHLALAGAQELG